MKKQFPFVSSKVTVENTMRDVVIALIPCILVSLFNYGLKSLMMILTSVITALVVEYVYSKLIFKKNTLLDGSAIVTSLLLALILPTTLPLKVVALGSFVAIFFGKLIWGGLGKNIFNPALMGRLVLMIFYPMFLYSVNNLDGTAGASLIPEIKYLGLERVLESSNGIFIFLKNLIIGSRNGALGETSILAILLGYAYLVKKKHIDWKIPLIFISTMIGMTFIYSDVSVVNSFLGGAFFASVFMITDMVTSPVTKLGQYIYVILLAIVTSIIRYETSFPEGITIAVLIMNVFVPLINNFSSPRVFGKKYNFLNLALLFVSIIALISGNKIAIGKLSQEKELNRSEIRKKLKEEKKTLFSEGVIYKTGEEIEKEGFEYTQVVNYDKDQVGYLIEGESKGHAKNRVAWVVAVDNNGEILNLKILEQNETFLLGDQIEEKSWQERWKGRDLNYKFSKEEDAFTGATYTSYNIYKSVIKALETLEIVIEEQNEGIDSYSGATVQM